MTRTPHRRPRIPAASTARTSAMLAALCAGVLWLAAVPAGAVEVGKSPTDSRDYLAFTLDNGLGVLVVSDPFADKAAAALDVNVGSGSNPEGREGLAHFLEHMLFLGTERYPLPALGPELLREKTLQALLAPILAIEPRQPLVIVFEDLHWADPSTVEMLVSYTFDKDDEDFSNVRIYTKGENADFIDAGVFDLDALLQAE